MTSPAAPLSSLFTTVSTWHAGRPWGRVLDAGTGRGSLRWLGTLGSEAWDAVTGAEGMAAQLRGDPDIRIRAQDRLVVGNWQDEALLRGERYDVVLADYLLGAVEGFSPYWQHRLFPRLRPMLRDGGHLYVIGLEPYVPFAPAPGDEAGALVTEIGRLRDACLLLAGERPYREFPQDWVEARLHEAGFEVLRAERFPIRYGERFVHGQLDMCVRRAQRLADLALGRTLQLHAEQLRTRALHACARLGGLRHGADYVIAARPRPAPG